MRKIKKSRAFVRRPKPNFGIGTMMSPMPSPSPYWGWQVERTQVEGNTSVSPPQHDWEPFAVSVVENKEFVWWRRSLDYASQQYSPGPESSPGLEYSPSLEYSPGMRGKTSATTQPSV
jgi:hypothetical protein